MAYTDAERARGQRGMIHEGVFVRIMEAATGGVILAGFAIALGANDFEVGLIAAIPFLAQVAHLPAIALLARAPDRKRVAVVGAVLARLLLLVIALVPLVALPLRPVHALIPLLVAYAALATVSGAAWQVWVRGLVPREELGRYFGRRMLVLATVGLVATILAGQFVTWWRTTRPEQGIVAFAILFAVGAVVGLVSSAVLARVPAAPAARMDAAGLGEIVRRPLRDRNYRRVLVFLGVWGFAANLSFPFLTVMLLTTLEFTVGTVVLLAALSQVSNIAGLRLLGPITDRFGNKPVLGIGALLFLVALVGWAVTPNASTQAVLLVAAGIHLVLGFAVAALDLASNGVVMKLAPEEDLAAYLSTASLVRAVTAGIAPLLGGAAATFLSLRAFSVHLSWTHPGGADVVTVLRFAHYDFLFLASAVLGLYAVHRLLGFEEVGEAPRSEVVRAMHREVAQISTIAGMRQFAHLASYLTESVVRRAPRRRRGPQM